MTLNQLLSSVLSLGFEASLDNTSQIYEAATRALDIIFTDKVITRTVTIDKIRPEITLHIPEYRHTGGDVSKSYKLHGKAVSFITEGGGAYALTEGNTTKTVNFLGNTEHRIILNGEAIITFFGSFVFSVKNLAAFDMLLSESEEDVPLFCELFRVNMEKEYPDYLYTVSEICDTNGTPLMARDEGGTLYIPHLLVGPVSLTYRRRAPDIFDMGMDKRLDIPRDAEAPLPFITASFMWLDDDTEKAQYYMALYRDMITQASYTRHTVPKTEYITNGWA